RLKASTQRDQEILRDVALGESGLPRFRAVHIDVQFRLIERLLNAQIHRARNVANLLQQVVGKLPVALQVIADNLHINGRGQTEVQNLAHDVGWKKCKRDTRKFIRQLDAQIVHVRVR